MKVLIIFLTLLFGTALANDCETLNLITEPNSPFQKMPVYDQDGAGICYAYVASQMLNYDLIKKGKPLSVHPAWAAYRYSLMENNEKLTAGSSSQAMKAITEAGNCNYQDVSAEIKEWAGKAKATEAEFISFIEKLAPRLQRIGYMQGNAQEDVVKLAIENAIKEQKPYCREDLNWTDLFPEILQMSFLGSRRLFSQLLFNGCPKLDQLETGKPVSFFNLNTQEFQDMLTLKLNTNKAPVAVMFCSKILSEPEYEGIVRTPEKDKTKSVTTNDCGGHEVIAVGKKKINNQCHTLIRNSWGNGFGKWTENRKCLCRNNETGEYEDECTIESHNNGKFSVEGCYISDSTLMKNTFGLTTLE